jgi:hypothetical protein
MDLIVTLSIKDTEHNDIQESVNVVFNAECRVSFIVILDIIMQSAIMLNAEGHNADYHYSECYHAECVIMPNVIMLSIVVPIAGSPHPLQACKKVS